MITNWHCDIAVSGLTQDCYITGTLSATTTVVQATDTPLSTFDLQGGSVIWGIGILIFFQSILFMGFLFNSFGFRKR